MANFRKKTIRFLRSLFVGGLMLFPVTLMMYSFFTLTSSIIFSVIYSIVLAGMMWFWSGQRPEVRPGYLIKGFAFLLVLAIIGSGVLNMFLFHTFAVKSMAGIGVIIGLALNGVAGLLFVYFEDKKIKPHSPLTNTDISPHYAQRTFFTPEATPVMNVQGHMTEVPITPVERGRVISGTTGTGELSVTSSPLPPQSFLLNEGSTESIASRGSDSQTVSDLLEEEEEASETPPLGGRQESSCCVM